MESFFSFLRGCGGEGGRDENQTCVYNSRFLKMEQFLVAKTKNTIAVPKFKKLYTRPKYSFFGGMKSPAFPKPKNHFLKSQRAGLITIVITSKS